MNAVLNSPRQETTGGDPSVVTTGTAQPPANDSGVQGSSGADASDAQTGQAQTGGGDPAASTKKVEDVVKDIERETEERIKKVREDGLRRIVAAKRGAVPLPQRKTAALTLLDQQRDRIRDKLRDPLLEDAEVDKIILGAIDVWHASQADA